MKRSKERSSLQTYTEGTFNTACQMTANFFVNKRDNTEENMKKQALDVLIAGAVLYGIGAAYGAVVAFTGVRDIAFLSYGVIGYLTVRVTNALRNK